ncbi:MAG: elongation factor P [Candidatus Omnitrophica bacterium]|nr:elongation factor P [Candidatus Omnitrophota bacterium]MBD3269660.1 elongation factor P [Candidatus Omnitrophota bacterium]
MGISISDIKPSTAIVYNGELYAVLSCEHAKIARGSAFCRVKLKNFKTSQVLDCTLRDSDNIDSAFIEKKKLQYIYSENERYHFMDLETYEDLILHLSAVKDKTEWLKDNIQIYGIFYENELIDLELPLSIELKVIDTEPGFRGNTVKGGTKPAKLETGLVINVPLFVDKGDTVKVDTRTKEYLGRV